MKEWNSLETALSQRRRRHLLFCHKSDKATVWKVLFPILLFLSDLVQSSFNKTSVQSVSMDATILYLTGLICKA